MYLHNGDGLAVPLTEAGRSRFRFQALLAVLAVTCLIPCEPISAQGKNAGARCVKVHGALLSQAQGAWENIAADADVPADRTVIALFGAELKSNNGAVEVRMIADVGQRGPFPVLESAARFGVPGKGDDLDITIERGVVVLINAKKKGAAKVRLHVRGESVEIILHEPKSKLGIEAYSRHLPGMPEIADAKKDVPVTTVAMFALAGETMVGTGKSSARLHAPPGPALLLWDSVTRDVEIHRHETLPDSVKPLDAKEKEAFDGLCHCTKDWFADPSKAAAALEKAAGGKDAAERKAAIVALGAMDDLPRLVNLLGDKDNADTRDVAILTLRHWLGRQSGQSGRLYQHLTKEVKFTPVQARNLVYLLAGIEEEKRRQPQTYVMLIQALNASKLPTRELARWHLDRLVPDSKAIGYDAAAAEATRLEKMAAYRKLVPEGELPKAPKKAPNP